MSRYSLLLTVFFLFGCSFSKENSGRDKVVGSTELVISKKPDIRDNSQFENLNSLQTELIKHKLASLSKSPPKDVDSKRLEIVEFNFMNKLLREIVSGNDLRTFQADLNKISCVSLEKSLIYQFMLVENGESFLPVEVFLKKTECHGSVTKKDLQFIYYSEAQRQFQNRFKNLSLLKFVLSHPGFTFSSLIPIGNSGVSLSLVVLKRVASSCPSFHSEPDEFLGGEYFPGCKNADDVDEENKFRRELGIQQNSYELTLLEEGYLVLKVRNFDVHRAYNDSVIRMIIDYMIEGQLDGAGFIRAIRNNARMELAQ